MAISLCRLCKQPAELRHSHILPEFFYTKIYESQESHKALAITKNGERVIQKGLREYLFCQQCETKFSGYETYVARLLRSLPSFRKDLSERFLFSDDTDYRKLKLFQISLLWRMGISGLDEFSDVQLGPHEDKLRIMLVNENPGSSNDYGCVMMIMLKTEVIHKVMSSPTRIQPKPFGHIAYKLATGNITWVFFVTNHHLPDQVKDFFAQESGYLRIWLAHDETKRIINIAKNLQKIELSRNN